MRWRVPERARWLTLNHKTTARDQRFLLDVMASQCPYFSLVWDLRHGRPRRSALDIARKLSPYQIGESSVLEWPANKIMGPLPARLKPILRMYRTETQAIQLLKRTRSSLFKWLGPDFPEDPCFYYDNRECAMITSSHERFAYVLVRHGSRKLMGLLAPLFSKPGLTEM
jgi:hypothetical protein